LALLRRRRPQYAAVTPVNGVRETCTEGAMALALILAKGVRRLMHE
jgi:hypothetical protein